MNRRARRSVRDIVTDVRPLVLVVPLLATASLACSSSDVSEPSGFSTAYMATPQNADGGTADAGMADGAAADGPASEAGTPIAFRAVTGSGPGSAFAVGDDGLAAFLSGSTWFPVETG